MSTVTKLSIVIAVFSCLGAGLVFGDWDPGDGYKTVNPPQLPDPNGWDVCLSHHIIADDFQCAQSGPVTDIHFWISWRDDVTGVIPSWSVAIYNNVVVDNVSRPGQELWRFREGDISIRPAKSSMLGWICPESPLMGPEIMPSNHLTCAQVNLRNIQKPFRQEEGQVYWLVIGANMIMYEAPIIEPAVGWTTSQGHWGSFALHYYPMSGIGGDTWRPVDSGGFPTGSGRHDMAFVITGRDGPARQMDFGDADESICDPTGVITRCNRYRTTLANDGARHVIDPAVFLGDPVIDSVHIDPEPDGQPTVGADGDDNSGFDDEDGVNFTSVLVPGQDATVEVFVSVDGFLNAWIDFNGDGDWEDYGERIFVGQAVSTGSNLLTFKVAATTSDHSPKVTYARFRFSTQEHLKYFGPAVNGEVEDYTVTIESDPDPRLDFGDTPDGDFAPSGYPTILLTNGARHIINPNVRMGRHIDGERDGNPTIGADGDDNDGLVDDEDGVFFVSPLIPGQKAKLEVAVSVGGSLFGWIDFNADNDWDDAGEQIFAGTSVSAGLNYLEFDVPNAPAAAENVMTYARFRFTTTKVVLGYSGQASDGEVEDYAVKIEHSQPAFDFGDADESRCENARCNTYPTTLARNGARHIIDPEVYLGSAIDAEIDGQPTEGADGDDTTGVDDEDGVVFASPIVPGSICRVKVIASTKGRLFAWIDFNADGDWGDYGEQIFNGRELSEGVNHLKFKVPSHAISAHSRTYARFRFSRHGRLKFYGPARDGEVEDYLVKIKEPGRNADLGDAPDSSNSFNVPMTAYASSGVLPVTVHAKYPTVYKAGSPPYGPIHRMPDKVAYLGTKVSVEVEADFGFDEDPTNNIIPPKDAADLDRADDGVKVPLVLPHCRRSKFDYLVKVVRPVDELYVNVWFDFNRDGDWNDTLDCNCNDETALSHAYGLGREWAVRNQLLSNLPKGIHNITTPGFLPWHPSDRKMPIWMRITVSGQPWKPSLIATTAGGMAVGGSGPEDGYWIGETEDYMFVPENRRTEFADLNNDLKVGLADFFILASQWLAEELIIGPAEGGGNN